jgi:glycosyltransferase involved in cell wall biosynthesis
MKISIVTINYNNKDGLRKTIESVVNQTYRNIEYIIIDGASTDGSTDIIRTYEDAIAYWVSEPDRGIYNAMNKGESKATGDYILFLNSGDYLVCPTVIEEICYEFSSHEDIIFGLLKTYPSNLIGYTDIHLPLTMQDFFERSPIPHPASFIKRDLFKEIKYDENLKIVSDWKFFLQAIVFKGCSYKKIEKVITIFEDEGLSSSNIECCNNERVDVLKKLLPVAIFADYFKFSSGMEFRYGNYEMFYSRLQPYKYGKIIYMLSVLSVRVISVFKRSARFAWSFPLK